MSAKSLPNQPTPKSSSPLDKAVQELIELRTEKQKYRELQALLRQGLDTLRKQQEVTEQAEFKFRQTLKSITDISLRVEEMDLWMSHAAKQVFGGCKNFIYLPHSQRSKVIHTTREELLGLSIQHHEAAIKILKETLDVLQNEKEIE